MNDSFFFIFYLLYLTMDFDFNDIQLPIPANVYKYSKETQYSIYCYLKQLDERHRQAYCIAFDLGTSFHILRSNGYIQWLKSK